MMSLRICATFLILCIGGQGFQIAEAVEAAPGRCQSPDDAACASAADDETAEEMSLMQFRGVVGKAAPGKKGGSLDSDFSFLQDLLKQHAEGKLKKLPAEIAAFIKPIEDNANSVQTTLKADHDLWAAEIIKRKDAFGTCTAEQKERSSATHDLMHPLSQAAQKKHCDCRGSEAELSLDHKSCTSQVGCLKDIMDAKQKDIEDFLAREDHCEACTMNHADQEGADEYAKMRAWLTSRKTECAAFYKGKAEEFEGLKKALADATAAHDAAKEKCDAAKNTHTLKTSECEGDLTSATDIQCQFRAKTRSDCDVYEECHSSASTEWDGLYAIQIVDYKDRMKAHLATMKIKCILGVFTVPEGGGDVQIDGEKGKACADLTCDGTPECAALGMADALDWTKPELDTCKVPPELCNEGTVDPACALDASGGYTAKSVTPAEKVECSASHDAKPRIGEVSTSCEQCDHNDQNTPAPATAAPETTAAPPKTTTAAPAEAAPTCMASYGKQNHDGARPLTCGTLAGDWKLDQNREEILSVCRYSVPPFETACKDLCKDLCGAAEAYFANRDHNVAQTTR